MKLKIGLLLTTACVLVWASSLTAQAGPARTQLEQFSSGLETLRADFDQKVVSTDGQVEDDSAGRVWLSRPNRFRWEYGGDFPELVVADGLNLWIYDVMLDQVTVEPQSGLGSDSPLSLLTDISLLDEQFEVRELGDDTGLQLLELNARDSEAGFERVLLGLKDGELVLMAMEDAFGLRTEIHFRGIQRNPVLEGKLFSFQPPESADVIGELPTTGPEH